LLSATGTGTAASFSLPANANNHITTAPFAYDAAGNETADAAGIYTWNAEGTLKTAGGVTYTYDGDGRRVRKSNGKIYWYGGGQVIEESDAAGNMQEAYVFFDEKRIARRDYQNNVFYYFADQINSSRVIAEIVSGGSTFTLCYDADFYPFGGEDVFTNTCPQNYKWTGKERDAETGNDDFDARYYSSVYGRFLSADWSAVPAAVPYANLTNPQTLNLYAIVRDNPESFADLDGHDWATAWSDLKSFGQSFYFKVSVGGGIGIKGKLGPLEGKIGSTAKVGLESSEGVVLKVSKTVEAGGELGSATGLRGGESISATQSMQKNMDGSVTQDKVLEKTDTFGGHSTSGIVGKDQVGIGIEGGAVVVGGIELGFTKGGLRALGDAFSQARDALSTGQPPPAPTRPSVTAQPQQTPKFVCQQGQPCT
jgi:RHS repeat-associated protein